MEVIRAFRQSPNSEYARAASRSLRDSISINERLLTGFGPYVSFGAAGLALANAGVHLDRHTIAEATGSPLTWGGRRPCGGQADRHHGRHLAGAAHGPRPALARADPAAGRRGRGAVRHRFHDPLFIVDLAIDDPRSADLARVGVLAASVIAFALGWAFFRITDRLQPACGRGLKLVRAIEPERDHIAARSTPH